MCVYILLPVKSSVAFYKLGISGVNKSHNLIKPGGFGGSGLVWARDTLAP